MTHRGKIVLITGPAGCGKTTVAELLRDRYPSISKTVSATTRAPREQERFGVDYYFISDDMFERCQTNGEFVETTEIHGNRYATLAVELERILATGNNVVIALDTAGVENFWQLGYTIYPIFLDVPSVEEQLSRLRNRQMVVDENDILNRIRKTTEEVNWGRTKENEGKIQYIINDDLDKTMRIVLLFLESNKVNLQLK